jgi:hypothetical protein
MSGVTSAPPELAEGHPPGSFTAVGDEGQLDL